jgi:hypothetical protein
MRDVIWINHFDLPFTLQCHCLHTYICVKKALVFGSISLCARVWHSLNVLTPPYILILTFGLVDDFDECDLGFMEGFNLEEREQLEKG